MTTRLQRVLEDSVLPTPWWELPVIPDPGLGVKGVRSSEYPCECFDPGPAAGDCETDGHYLCIECRNLNPKSEYVQVRRFIDNLPEPEK